MILHLSDDEKFIDDALEQFEACCPNNNKLIVGIAENDHQLKHVKTDHNMQVQKYNCKDYAVAVGNLEDYEFVVIHSLDLNKAKVICNASDKVKILWLIWGGGDVIGPLDYDIRECFDKNSIKLFFKNYSRNYLIYILKRIYHTTVLGDLFKKCLKDKDINKIIIESAIKKIKYCSTVVPKEYDIYRRKSRLFSSKCIPFNYSYIEKITANMQYELTGDNILVGNSGFYTLNHLSVFLTLKKYNNERKIIVPLNYGDKTYINELIKIGNKLFNNKFYPVLNFLAAEEYIKIILSCNIAIFNSTIQQAMGNIILCIYFGITVYLNCENPICSFLDELEIKYLDATKDLKKGIITFDKDTLQRNRQHIVEYYKRDNVFNRCKNMVNYILNE